MKKRLFTASWLIPALVICVWFNFVKIPYCLIIALMGWEILKNQMKTNIWTAIIIFQMHGLIWIKYMSRIEIFFLATIIVLNDSAAYFGGRFLNFRWKKQPFPDASPKKTYAGLAYGLVFATVGAIIFEYYLPIFEGIRTVAITGFILAWFGILGDYTESKFKRANGLDDSGQGMLTGRILMGHGGVLDRFDAVSMALWGWLLIKLFLKFFV